MYYEKCDKINLFYGIMEYGVGHYYLEIGKLQL